MVGVFGLEENVFYGKYLFEKFQVFFSHLFSCVRCATGGSCYFLHVHLNIVGVFAYISINLIM